MSESLRMDRNFCPKCKTLKSKFDKYCEECGTELQQVNTINGIKVHDEETLKTKEKV